MSAATANQSIRTLATIANQQTRESGKSGEEEDHGSASSASAFYQPQNTQPPTLPHQLSLPQHTSSSNDQPPNFEGSYPHNQLDHPSNYSLPEHILEGEDASQLLAQGLRAGQKTPSKRGRKPKSPAGSAEKKMGGDQNKLIESPRPQGQNDGEFSSDNDGNQLVQQIHYTSDLQPHENENENQEEDPTQSIAKRRENHKEVERRRRDNINAGINELAKIVPECEKNKGSILHKSVEYIKYLQKANLATIEKWREEKKESEEQILNLTQEIEELKADNDSLRRQLASYTNAKKRKPDEIS